MAQQWTPRIHPTALIATDVVLADDVQIGPYSILEGEVRLGPGCIVGPHVHLIGPIRIGKHNQLHTGVVLGDRPQHMKYRDEPTSIEIGDNNIFREHVTVHRATTHSWVTRIGSGNFFMAHSHIAHDCQVGNNCIFANGALVGGHCVIGDNVILSGNCAVHQFVRMGRLALLSGTSATTKDIPPFVMQQGVNHVVGVNVVGMRRAGVPRPQIDAVRKAYRMLYEESAVLSAAIFRMESELGTFDAVQEMVCFLREGTRGIASVRDRHQQDHEAA